MGEADSRLGRLHDTIPGASLRRVRVRPDGLGTVFRNDNSDRDHSFGRRGSVGLWKLDCPRRAGGIIRMEASGRGEKGSAIPLPLARSSRGHGHNRNGDGATKDDRVEPRLHGESSRELRTVGASYRLDNRSQLAIE